MEVTLSDQVEFIGGAYSSEQTELFKKWAASFGAVDAKELDLGILIFIHEQVTNGAEPNSQHGER